MVSHGERRTETVSTMHGENLDDQEAAGEGGEAPCLQNVHIPFLPTPFSNTYVLLYGLGALAGVLYAIIIGFKKAILARSSPALMASLTNIDTFPLFDVVVCPAYWDFPISVTATYVEEDVARQTSIDVYKINGTIDTSSTSTEEILPEFFFYPPPPPSPMPPPLPPYKTPPPSPPDYPPYVAPPFPPFYPSAPSAPIWTNVHHKRLVLGVAQASDCWLISSATPLIKYDAAAGFLDSSSGVPVISRANFKVNIAVPIEDDATSTPVVVGIIPRGQNPTAQLSADQLSIFPSLVNKQVYFNLATSLYFALKPYVFSWKRLAFKVSESPDPEFFEETTKFTVKAYDASIALSQPGDAAYTVELNFFSAGCNWIQTVEAEYYTYDDNDAAQNMFTYVGLFSGTIIPVLMSVPNLLTEWLGYFQRARLRLMSLCRRTQVTLQSKNVLATPTRGPTRKN